MASCSYLSATTFCKFSASEVTEDDGTSDLIWDPPEAADLKEAVLALKEEVPLVVFKTTDAEFGLLGTLGGNGGGLSTEPEIWNRYSI